MKFPGVSHRNKFFYWLFKQRERSRIGRRRCFFGLNSRIRSARFAGHLPVRIVAFLEQKFQFFNSKKLKSLTTVPNWLHVLNVRKVANIFLLVEVWSSSLEFSTELHFHGHIRTMNCNLHHQIILSDQDLRLLSILTLSFFVVGALPLFFCFFCGGDIFIAYFSREHHTVNYWNTDSFFGLTNE